MKTPVVRPGRPTPRRRRPSTWALVAIVAIVMSVFALVPSVAIAADSTMVPACDGVNLRTSTSTGATVKVRLGLAARVTVATSVSGGRWSTTCPTGKSGSGWYRVSAVNGRSVTSLYGVSYLYAATGVLKGAPDGTLGSADAIGSELVRLINLDRSALGKVPYLVDARLADIARDAAFTCPTNASLRLSGRARDMADRGYFSHTVPGCYLAGTSTPYPSLQIVRSVFGYAQARSEILHWNSNGTAPTTYKLGCDIGGTNCVGGTTTTPQTVATAQRNFMSSSPHRAAELNKYQRIGCGSATVPGTTKRYFACLFADSGPSAAVSPAPTPTPAPTPSRTPTPTPSRTPTPTPTPTPSPTPTPPPTPTPTPTPTAATGAAMTPACSGANLRTSASTGATKKASLSPGATVTVVATVSGGSWSTICATSRSGSRWYKINAVNGRSVSSLYGVSYVYAATGVLKAAPTPAPTPLAATVTFYGRGYGHGVGLSQYGARGRALAGQDAATITAHYYAGTTIGALSARPNVRVLLLDDVAPTATAPLTIVGRGGRWSITGVTGPLPADARARLTPVSTNGSIAWRLVVDRGGVTIADVAAGTDIVAAPIDAGTNLELTSKPSPNNLYRGTLRVLLTGALADVVNTVPLESYLRAVVPAEMPSSWPAEALKAQALAARSYAVANLRGATAAFDVYDDTRSQVYQGVRREAVATDAAVAATDGRVIMSGLTVAKALFHSTGGGATENNEYAFTSSTGAITSPPVPYLRGSPDRDAAGVPYDAAAPNATWKTASYTLSALSAIFAADSRTDVGSITGLYLGSRGASGRLIRVTLYGSTGVRTVSGDVFVGVFNARRPAGDPSMRSTLLDLQPIP